MDECHLYARTLCEAFKMRHCTETSAETSDNTACKTCEHRHSFQIIVASKYVLVCCQERGQHKIRGTDVKEWWSNEQNQQHIGFMNNLDSTSECSSQDDKGAQTTEVNPQNSPRTQTEFLRPLASPYVPAGAMNPRDTSAPSNSSHSSTPTRATTLADSTTNVKALFHDKANTPQEPSSNTIHSGLHSISWLSTPRPRSGILGSLMWTDWFVPFPASAPSSRRLRVDTVLETLSVCLSQLYRHRLRHRAPFSSSVQLKTRCAHSLLRSALAASFANFLRAAHSSWQETPGSILRRQPPPSNGQKQTILHIVHRLHVPSFQPALGFHLTRLNVHLECQVSTHKSAYSSCLQRLGRICLQENHQVIHVRLRNHGRWLFRCRLEESVPNGPRP